MEADLYPFRDMAHVTSGVGHQGADYESGALQNISNEIIGMTRPAQVTMYL